MRNQVMRHAFESLPQTVLDTPVGRMIFRVMQRQASNFKKGYRKGPKRG